MEKSCRGCFQKWGFKKRQGNQYKFTTDQRISLHILEQKHVNSVGIVDKYYALNGWEVRAARVSMPEGKLQRGDIHGDHILFERSDVTGKVQKSILFRFDKELFPKTSEVIGYHVNSDLSQFSVQVLQGEKVKEYTFKVTKQKDEWNHHNLYERVAIREVPLSDFYVGKVETRQTGNGPVKGMSVGSNAK